MHLCLSASEADLSPTSHSCSSLAELRRQHPRLSGVEAGSSCRYPQPPRLSSALVASLTSLSPYPVERHAPLSALDENQTMKYSLTDSHGRRVQMMWCLALVRIMTVQVTFIISKVRMLTIISFIVGSTYQWALTAHKLALHTNWLLLQPVGSTYQWALTTHKLALLYCYNQWALLTSSVSSSFSLSRSSFGE